jgi:hypothetical protein
MGTPIALQFSVSSFRFQVGACLHLCLRQEGTNETGVAGRRVPDAEGCEFCEIWGFKSVTVRRNETP